MELHRAIVELESFSPYSQSNYIDQKPARGENPRDFEARVWRKRMHVTDEGYVKIPAMAFKHCLSEAAAYRSIRIPGKGTATFTKHFEAGIMVADDVVLPVKADDIPGTWYFLPSDGKPGGGKRVMKCFGNILKWKAQVTFHILDSAITQEVFLQHIEEAGMFIGIGRFRPRRRGTFGRFTVKSLKWV